MGLGSYREKEDIGGRETSDARDREREDKGNDLGSWDRSLTLKIKPNGQIETQAEATARAKAEYEAGLEKQAQEAKARADEAKRVAAEKARNEAREKQVKEALARQKAAEAEAKAAAEAAAEAKRQDEEAAALKAIEEKRVQEAQAKVRAAEKARNEAMQKRAEEELAAVEKARADAEKARADTAKKEAIAREELAVAREKEAQAVQVQQEVEEEISRQDDEYNDLVMGEDAPPVSMNADKDAAIEEQLTTMFQDVEKLEDLLQEGAFREKGSTFDELKNIFSFDYDPRPTYEGFLAEEKRLASKYPEIYGNATWDVQQGLAYFTALRNNQAGKLAAGIGMSATSPMGALAGGLWDLGTMLSSRNPILKDIQDMFGFTDEQMQAIDDKETGMRAITLVEHEKEAHEQFLEEKSNARDDRVEEALRAQTAQETDPTDVTLDVTPDVITPSLEGEDIPAGEVDDSVLDEYEDDTDINDVDDVVIDDTDTDADDNRLIQYPGVAAKYKHGGVVQAEILGDQSRHRRKSAKERFKINKPLGAQL